jgi:hypothetical protein
MGWEAWNSRQRMALLRSSRFGEREEMLALSARELKAVFEAQRECEIFLIEKVADGSRHWEMTIRVPSQQKEYHVQKFRGQTKTWKRLDSVFDFIEETCPTAEIVHVIRVVNEHVGKAVS